MPRNMPAPLLAKVKTDSTNLCTIAKITRRDGVILYLTDLDVNLTVGGDLYRASDGYNRKSIEHRAGTKVDETEMTALFSSSFITSEDLANGLYSYAEVLLSLVYWPDVSLGTAILQRGRVGAITRGSSGGFKFDIRDVTERLLGKVGRIVTPECGWFLGDPKTCKIPLLPDDVLRNTAYVVGDFVKDVVAGGANFAVYGNVIFECTVAGVTGGSSPTWDVTPGNTTSDGGVTWKAYEAWTRHGVIASLIDETSFTVTVTEARAVDEWFSLGSVFFLSGDNITGRPNEIQSWTNATSTVLLALPVIRPMQVGDAFRISPGCDLVRGGHCLNKFVMAGSFRFSDGNAKRHGGFDSLPGRQFLRQNVHAND